MAGNRDLYIDLLLFHRRLRSLIAIELKIGEFEAEYAGKMQLYLTALDEQVKLPDENPSIGIIICKNKEFLPRSCPLWISCVSTKIVNRIISTSNKI